MDDPRSAEPGRRGASFTHRSLATLLSRRGCRDAAGCCASGCAHVLGLGGQCLGVLGALPSELRLGAAEVSAGRALLVDRSQQAERLPQTVGCQVDVLAYP